MFCAYCRYGNDVESSILIQYYSQCNWYQMIVARKIFQKVNRSYPILTFRSTQKKKQRPLLKLNL
ncbi:hypothetical protein NC651_025875 [Populus alba x Populus x berolinensis]|nr:hypothetical protein NC651_025875 [Populus alba x Populus x berolinensis]